MLSSLIMHIITHVDKPLINLNGWYNAFILLTAAETERITTGIQFTMLFYV